MSGALRVGFSHCELLLLQERGERLQTYTATKVIWNALCLRVTFEQVPLYVIRYELAQPTRGSGVEGARTSGEWLATRKSGTNWFQHVPS